MTQHPIIRFYSGTGSTPDGYTLSEIWGWNRENLEYVHTYIQWLFPMRERSNFNPSAPTLDDGTIQEFTTSPQLQENLIKSFQLMLDFYGFEMSGDKGDIKVTRSSNFELISPYWLNPYNHNLLRITRILNSLRTLGCGEYAKAFLLCLHELYKQYHDEIGENTMNYWNNAVR